MMKRLRAYYYVMQFAGLFRPAVQHITTFLQSANTPVVEICTTETENGINMT